MARGIVTSDPFGIAGTALKMVSYGDNPSIEDATAKDEKGDVIVRDTFEAIDNPSIDYELATDFPVAGVQLGVLTNEVVVTGFSFDSSAGSPPKVSISGESVPASATQEQVYTTPTFTLSKNHIAQIICDAYTLTGDGNHTESCSGSFSCSLTRSKGEDGETVAYDVSEGKIEVSATIVKSAAVDPVVTPAADYVVTSPLAVSETGADYEKLNITMILDLQKVDASV